MMRATSDASKTLEVENKYLLTYVFSLKIGLLDEQNCSDLFYEQSLALFKCYMVLCVPVCDASVT
jgi:hypothetical protein